MSTAETQTFIAHPVLYERMVARQLAEVPFRFFICGHLFCPLLEERRRASSLKTGPQT